MCWLSSFREKVECFSFYIRVVFHIIGAHRISEGHLIRIVPPAMRQDRIRGNTLIEELHAVDSSTIGDIQLPYRALSTLERALYEGPGLS
jgi:hypothetical protein